MGKFVSNIYNWLSRNNNRSILFRSDYKFYISHIGNVGTNIEDNEADKLGQKGYLNSNITDPSNYRSIKKLDKWLKRKIIGIVGLDTRVITNYIRDKGAPKEQYNF